MKVGKDAFKHILEDSGKTMHFWTFFNLMRLTLIEPKLTLLYVYTRARLIKLSTLSQVINSL